MQLAAAEADMDVFQVQGPQGACPRQEVEAAADLASDCSDLLGSSGRSMEPVSITCELARGIVDDLPEDVHERRLTNVLPWKPMAPLLSGPYTLGRTWRGPRCGSCCKKRPESGLAGPLGPAWCTQWPWNGFPGSAIT